MHLLQSGPVVPVGLRLAFESCTRCTYAKYSPVLLKQAKVGRIVRLVISCKFFCVSILTC